MENLTGGTPPVRPLPCVVPCKLYFSAVEATCRIIAEKDSATLGEALKLLAKHGLKLHPCLNSGIDKLYSYACDQGGVRHAEHEAESIVTFEEAKFMMVTCSAIVNYLVAEYGKHGTENA